MLQRAMLPARVGLHEHRLPGVRGGYFPVWLDLLSARSGLLFRCLLSAGPALHQRTVPAMYRFRLWSGRAADLLRDRPVLLRHIFWHRDLLRSRHNLHEYRLPALFGS